MGNLSWAYGNMQGSYKFLSLVTGKKVMQRKFTEMPMTNSVIRRINKLRQERTIQEWPILQK